MKSRRLSFYGCTLFTLLFGACLHAGTSNDVPNVEEAIRKVVTRAHWAKSQDFQRQFAFTRITVTEDLDEKNRVTSKKEKTSHVVAPKKRSADSKGKSDEKTRNVLLELLQNRNSQFQSSSEVSDELLARFEFRFVAKEILDDRPTLLFKFEPKKQTLPNKRIEDRVINRACGLLWIDEEDFEIAKADLHLSEPVNLAGGVIASLQACRFVLERTRFEQGVWLFKQTELEFKARELLNLVHVRKQQQWKDFKKSTGE